MWAARSHDEYCGGGERRRRRSSNISAGVLLDEDNIRRRRSRSRSRNNKGKEEEEEENGGWRWRPVDGHHHNNAYNYDGYSPFPSRAHPPSETPSNSPSHHAHLPPPLSQHFNPLSHIHPTYPWPYHFPSPSPPSFHPSYFSPSPSHPPSHPQTNMFNARLHCPPCFKFLPQQHPQNSSAMINNQRHGLLADVQHPRRSTWKDEILPVPPDLVKETDSKSLAKLVKQGVEAYIDDMQRPHHNYHDFKTLKTSPIISGGSLYHYKPPNLGKQDLEDWKVKRKRKKASKSSYNVAFGRTETIPHSLQEEDSPQNATSSNDIGSSNQAKKNSTSYLKCLRGKLNARREVLKAIHDYHINSEARAQLEKKASEFEREKRERMQQKIDLKYQAAIRRRGRRSAHILDVIQLRHTNPKQKQSVGKGKFS